MRIRRFAVALMSCAVTSCAISPGPEILMADFCDIPQFHLAVESGGGQPLQDSSSFSQALASTYQERSMRLDMAVPISESMLFLSGGSQHGAFGAGALEKWARQRPGGLPRFQVVTGVSTGAIMATHAFLNRTDHVLASYQIDHEDKVLDAHVQNPEKLGIPDGIAIARKGAFGNLQPMKKFLGDEIDDQIILDVARESREFKRRLFIGAVDVDSGRAVVFDLTQLAEKFERQVNRRKRLRDCYLDAIVASSSVPLAAPPTFIDNSMYIDGGARFGLLANEIARGAEAISLADSREPAQSRQQGVAGGYPYMYVIINGDLELDTECGKANEALCKTPSNGSAGLHKDWKITSLAQRSVSILIDQIYRFSNSRIREKARLGGFTVEMLRIGNDVLNFSASISHTPTDTTTRTCGKWMELDKEIDKPIEFHPRYMHCLTKYGDARVVAAQWASRE